MSLKQNYIWTFLKLLREFIPEAICWNKHNIDLRDNTMKCEADLTIRIHALEKGMSLGHVRLGFGQPKVLSILNDLNRYVSLGGNVEFVKESLGIIMQYLKFNDFSKENEAVKAFESFCTKHQVQPSPAGGILKLNYRELCKTIYSDFAHFSQTRHAIRDFGATPIEQSAIYNALKICERTPSACNRQSWHVYVIDDKQKRDTLMEIQGGVKGCNEEIQSAILVCGDMRHYGSGENNLPYVDGGLYAMNLMYALHFEGLANIPLSMSYNRKRINQMKQIIGVPEYELPVLLIAIGSYKEEFKVAASVRKDYKEYTTII